MRHNIIFIFALVCVFGSLYLICTRVIERLHQPWQFIVYLIVGIIATIGAVLAYTLSTKDNDHTHHFLD